MNDYDPDNPDRQLEVAVVEKLRRDGWSIAAPSVGAEGATLRETIAKAMLASWPGQCVDWDLTKKEWEELVYGFADKVIAAIPAPRLDIATLRPRIRAAVEVILDRSWPEPEGDEITDAVCAVLGE